MNDIEYQNMYEVEDTHWWYVSLHELICSYIADERRGKGAPLDILDAGCGTGRLMQLMERFGTVEGFDMSEHALGFCRARGMEHTRLADLNEVELGENRYDVITSIDVIYHLNVRDEAAVFKKLYRALKPGGLLILNLVAFEFLRSTHDIAVHTRRRYTRASLHPLLTMQGFHIETSSYRPAFPFLPIALYRLVRRILPCSSDPEMVISDVPLPIRVVNDFLLHISRFENRLIRARSLPFGTSLFITARC
ncbi:putative S-adenosylmethionine-dependent methyltransferase [Geobacter sp. OR-1]|uniref:class I SAM-dependent methyltransferase n=1 Tax=Geobacter sp. OR-1 TaxID=1266765 RepID=UPI000543E795|nr:class I SAM-dependent methyltransferase [Geobacter sp. OR-1]GAM09064.1 putative S-adenosylmethionine-dependent methyltransferase [Geobacter sp. OR-1]